MTLEKVHAQIRASKRWCRGKSLHSEEEQQALAQRYDEGTDDDRRALKHELEAKFKLPSKPEATREEIHAALLPLIYPFGDNTGQGWLVCGENINELIIADGKFDGEDHELICPKCGAKHTYSALFEIEAG